MSRVTFELKPGDAQRLRRRDAGIRALNAYDGFLAVLDDSEKRSELSALGMEDAPYSPPFTRIAELGEEFEAGLLPLLFDDPELHRWVRDYLIF